MTAKTISKQSYLLINITIQCTFCILIPSKPVFKYGLFIKVHFSKGLYLHPGQNIYWMLINKCICCDPKYGELIKSNVMYCKLGDSWFSLKSPSGYIYSCKYLMNETNNYFIKHFGGFELKIGNCNSAILYGILQNIVVRSLHCCQT